MKVVSKDEMKLIRLDEIDRPTSVRGFRENLGKFFLSANDRVYVRGEKTPAGYIDIAKLNCLSDLYSLLPNDRPMVIPMMTANSLYVPGEEVFYATKDVFVKRESPMWFSIDSCFIRDVLVSVLGEFSGYCEAEDVG